MTFAVLLACAAPVAVDVDTNAYCQQAEQWTKYERALVARQAEAMELRLKRVRAATIGQIGETTEYVAECSIHLQVTGTRYFFPSADAKRAAVKCLDTAAKDLRAKAKTLAGEIVPPVLGPQSLKPGQYGKLPHGWIGPEQRWTLTVVEVRSASEVLVEAVLIEGVPFAPDHWTQADRLPVVLTGLATDKMRDGMEIEPDDVFAVTGREHRFNAAFQSAAYVLEKITPPECKPPA